MGSFDTPSPAYGPAELQDMAARLFDVSGEMKALVGDRDQNVRLTAANGSYVLKIAHPGEDRAFLAFQNAAMDHLANVAPQLPLPRVVPSGQGEAIARWPQGAGEGHDVRLLTYLPGNLFSDATKTPALLRDLGRFMGQVSRSLQSFGHPGAHRPDFLWSLDNVLLSESYVSDIAQEDHRDLVAGCFAHYRDQVAPRLTDLRMAVIHNDANDNNLLVAADQPDQIAGLIDFGDMVFARQVNELAVMLAYAMMDQADPIAAATQVISGYTAEFPLTETEAEVLFDLAIMRLVMSVCISSHRAKDFPDNDYLVISQAPAFALLEKLHSYDRNWRIAVARQAAGFDAVATASAVRELFSPLTPLKVTSVDLPSEPRHLVEAGTLSPASLEEIFALQADGDQATYAISAYGASETLGTALYLAPGSALMSPLAGRVVEIAAQGGESRVVIAHRAAAGPQFYSSHQWDGSAQVRPDQILSAGDVIGDMRGDAPAGRLFLHLMTVLPSPGHAAPESCTAALWPVLKDIYLDPNLLLGLPPETFTRDEQGPAEMMAARRQMLAPSLSVAYARKLKMVRGKGAYLYDHTGRAFLDCVNNITHVGHCHPHVVGALSRQAALLNTNSRYLSENIQTLAARILATLPDPLEVMFFVNSGSEANELALRLTRAMTGRKTMVVLDHAYHGNTSSLVDISPYKFNGKGGAGCPDHVRIADFPDPYQGLYKGDGPDAAKAYVRETPRSVAQCVADLEAVTGAGPGGFIAESIAGVGGQVLYPDGYLAEAYKVIRAAGGLCIADEVQVGFGRVGSHMWAFETQGVVPDIVSLGKPIGNGHPLAAVATTREIAEKFANGMEYFNSFGGNPVSCAVGLAVLDVIENEKLQQKAQDTGDYILAGLRDLATRWPLIGDVRGRGMFIGAELVKDRDSSAPAAEEAGLIVQHLRDHGVLLSTDGPHENVLKLKPPMVFGRAEADIFLTKLDQAFAWLAAKK